MKRVPVSVPESVASAPIQTNYVKIKGNGGGDGNGEPMLLLHGFDSSLLEFRRLLPRLGEKGAEVYALDVLGWGFTDLSAVSSFDAGMMHI